MYGKIRGYVLPPFQAGVFVVVASVFIDFPFISLAFFLLFVKIIKLLELLFCYCSLILFEAGMTTIVG